MTSGIDGLISEISISFIMTNPEVSGAGSVNSAKDPIKLFKKN